MQSKTDHTVGTGTKHSPTTTTTWVHFPVGVKLTIMTSHVIKGACGLYLPLPHRQWRPSSDKDCKSMGDWTFHMEEFDFVSWTIFASKWQWESSVWTSACRSPVIRCYWLKHTVLFTSLVCKTEAYCWRVQPSLHSLHLTLMLWFLTLNGRRRFSICHHNSTSLWQSAEN